MTPNIYSLIKSMEDLMYGHNYEVCLGIDIFEGTTTNDFAKAVKNKYVETHPELCPLKALNKNECLADIKDKLNYRGDSGAGLLLTTEKESELQKLQQDYFNYLNQYVNEMTKFYHYSDPDGIPGDPVFWEYRYVMITDRNKIIFIYGSSSD